jgi:hypothetical protein
MLQGQARFALLLNHKDSVDQSSLVEFPKEYYMVSPLTEKLLNKDG